MIDRSWLTSDERDVLAAALDQYIGNLRKALDRDENSHQRNIATWRNHVASQLRHALNPL